MKKTIKNLLCLMGAVLIVMVLLVLFKNDEPIYVDVPLLKIEELNAREEEQQKQMHEEAIRARNKRIFSCSSDDDCIIVDKDPCGCLVGPQGVTAINAYYTLDFNKTQEKTLAKACPEVAPSNEKECSATARAVCAARTCKIVY